MTAIVGAEQLHLRQLEPVQPENPLDIIPQPGAMAELYTAMRGLREQGKYPDGMSLACAEVREGCTYNGVVEAYAARRDEEGFDPVAFWEQHFKALDDDPEVLEGAAGEPIESYLVRVRDRLILPSDERSRFDIKLPYPRAVAGSGRFGIHEFHWDGYHMAKGFAADGKWDLVMNIADNARYQIEKYGYPLNGSATFYASRPQPPYFSHTVRLLADKFGDEALVHYLPALEKEYTGYWMDGKEGLDKKPLGETHANRSLVRLPDGTYLNRYWDDADGPRLESYKEDVDVAAIAVRGLTGIARARKEAKVYKDLRAAAASGWDFSSRWLEKKDDLSTICTTDILPVDLNSLLQYSEETLAKAYEAKFRSMEEYNPERLHAMAKAIEYRKAAAQRAAAIRKYGWNEESGLFHDYNYKKAAQSDVKSAAGFYPLYVGIATKNETLRAAKTLKKEFLHPGGVATTLNDGLPHQWDGKERIWAPPNWAAARGLARMAIMLANDEGDERISPQEADGLFDLAERVRTSYTAGVRAVYDRHRITAEKHHGDDLGELGGGGEYRVVKILGMTGETYIALKSWSDVRQEDRVPPIGHSALSLALAA